MSLTDFISEWAIYRYVDLENITPSGFIIILISLLWSLILTVGFIRIICQKKTGAGFEDVLGSVWEDMGRILLSMFLVSALITPSMIIPIVGIYVALRMQFCLYYQIDERKYFMKSIKESIRLTRGSLMKQSGIWLIIIITYSTMVMTLIQLPDSFVDANLSMNELSAGVLNSSIIHFLLNTGMNLIIYITIILHVSMYLELKEEKSMERTFSKR